MKNTMQSVYLGKILLEKLQKREKSAVVTISDDIMLKAWSEKQINGKIDMLSVETGVDVKTALNSLGSVTHIKNYNHI